MEMKKNVRHIATGIEAVIDSAHVVTPYDIWVDNEDAARAVKTVQKLAGGVYKPSVYAGTDPSTGICIRLD